ncbi:MAG TPA: TetR/AcrR family transcriptional regulator [Actinomycetota bacterium]|jgi:AcrR family transcriptional regulator|nr:TetR/AcrR family transcriptional regulator [Actinomycetota bacterium]
MPRPSTDTRERLLAAAVEYAAEHGLADLSLRALAGALGTSHRMLIFHFGSKEGLLVEVVRAVEAQQRALLAELRADPDLDPLGQMQALWEHLTSPALWPYERLFFEVYAQGLLGKEPARRLLDDAIDAWLPPVVGLLTAQGVPPEEARAEARLSLAVTRGLLLDLLATRDLDAVNAAMGRFTQLYLHARPAFAAGDQDTGRSRWAPPRPR